MELAPTLAPTLAPIERYEELARALIEAVAAGSAPVNELVRRLHPRFRRADVPWLPRPTTADEVPTDLSLDDARLVVARGHELRDWDAVVAYTASLSDPAVARFETAVDAVVAGDVDGVRAALSADPALVRARSARITCFDPAVHRATLLHYLAANGTERPRQRTPPNAVDVAETLLAAGADPDALADFYGAPTTTMPLLVSSSHPADAGVQVALVERLVAYGASMDGAVWTALLFGYPDTAAALERLGADVDSLPLAAGLGRRDAVVAALPTADPLDRHRALAIAAQLGHVEVVRVLLDAGEPVDRFNPPGQHAHGTALHHAAGGGHAAVVELLLERGASRAVVDRIWGATPAGWADHEGHAEVAQALRAPER